MEKLKRKEILIGRESQKHRLLIAIKDEGRMATIGSEGSVPNSVSCCKPGENVAHCKLVISGDGVMAVHNLKPRNVTYVNGIEVEAKSISEKCDVMLGKDKYLINVGQILDTAKKLLDHNGDASGRSHGYSIRHLQRIWEQYEQDLYKLQKRQKSLGLIKSFYMPCTVLSGLVGFAFKYMGVENSMAETVSMIMYVIAAIVLFYGLYRTITDRSFEERKALDRKFQEYYVCPHCKHFLGFQPYHILKQNECCPYKRCKWIE